MALKEAPKALNGINSFVNFSFPVTEYSEFFWMTLSAVNVGDIFLPVGRQADLSLLSS